MRQSDSIAALAADLAKAQGELKNAPFNAVNPHFKNKYADLAGIRDCTAPILAKNGLVIAQGTVMEDGHCFLTTRLIHKSGEWLESVYPIQIDQPQKMGSAITYGRRYSWAAMLGIAGEPDDDGEATRTDGKSAFDVVPAPAPGISPKDFASVRGDPSSAQSGKAYQMLLPAMKANKTASELTGWWKDHQDEIKSMHTNGRWEFFEQMIEYGLSLCKKPLAVDLFFGNHETALNVLKKANREKFECLEEMMITRVAWLADPEAKVEFINAG